MSIKKLLNDGLSLLGLEASEEVVSGFETYLRDLKKWNKAYNLTSVTEEEEIVIKHFLDSLLYLKAIPCTGQTLTICDIGSGAGFPGIPLALVRKDLHVILIEPSRKRCAFLRNLKRTLGLKNTEVLENRVEEVTERTCDVVLTRALFSAGDLVRKAGRLAAEDGLFVLNKGPKFEQELADIPSGFTCKVTPVPLPLTDTVRNIITMRQDIKTI